jgi:hypothetical protein
MTSSSPSSSALSENLLTSSETFDYSNWYIDATGNFVQLAGISVPVTVPSPPHSVSFKDFVPDPRDPGNAPFIFPPGYQPPAGQMLDTPVDTTPPTASTIEPFEPLAPFRRRKRHAGVSWQDRRCHLVVLLVVLVASALLLC